MKVLQPGQGAVFSPAPSCNPHSGVELGLTDPVTSPPDYQGGLGISGDGRMAEELWGQTRMGQGRAEVGAGCRGWRMCSPLLPAGTAASLGCPSPEQGRAGQGRVRGGQDNPGEPFQPRPTCSQTGNVAKTYSPTLGFEETETL